jgi:hypothetical protein
LTRGLVYPILTLEEIRNMRKKQKRDQFEDQVRFNWGYHDAEWDHEHCSPRLLSYFGPQSVKMVSQEFDHAYYYGYLVRTRERENIGVYPYTGNSQRAWDSREEYGY